MDFTRIENGKRVCTERLTHPTQYHGMLLEAGFEKTQEVVGAYGNLHSSYKGCISVEMIGPPLFPFDDGEVAFILIHDGHRKDISCPNLSPSGAVRAFGDEVLQNIREIWGRANSSKTIIQ